MTAFNKIQRIIALILVVVMSLSVFAGCTPKGNGGNSDDEQNNTSNNGTSDNGNKPEDNPDKNPDDIPDDPTDEPTDEPHNCAFGEWVVVKQPTNTDEGIQERKCECGKVEQKAIPASGGEFAIYYNNLKTAEYPTQTGFNSSEGLLALPTPVANGYKFIGWFTASIGGEIVDYIPKGSTKDFVLFAHWELVTYDITYKNVPNNINPTSYTIETKLKLTNPKWSGLEFDYWSDDNGNKYYPDVNVTAFLGGMYGDLVLTANWKVLRNIATPAGNSAELYNVFSAEDGFIYFFYDLGTIEHVVLDNINPDMYYKYEGLPITLSLSKTVSITEETAQSIADTVSKSVSSTSSWSGTDTFSQTTSKNWNAQIGGGAELDIGGGKLIKKALGIGVKVKVEGHYNWGGGTDTTEGWTNTLSGSSSETDTTSHTVSTSISYKEEITSEITESITISSDLPSGYYAYVHAGNIRVVAVLSYEISTGLLYVNTYSRLDNMHSMIMYYADVNQLNNPPVEGLDFSIPEEEIKNIVENSYYVKYDANGGVGSMPTTLHSVDGNESLAVNEYTNPGHIFAGWELVTENGVQILQDGQSVTNLGKSLQTVTLKAIWDDDPDAVVIPTSVTKSGTISVGAAGVRPNIKYSAVIEYRNRTANSVEVRITWTATISSGWYTRYGQNFNFSVGNVNSGRVKVVNFDAWSSQSSKDRSNTKSSSWVTIPLNTTNATTVNLKVYYWQTNSNDVDMYKYDGTKALQETWSIDIPAYK